MCAEYGLDGIERIEPARERSGSGSSVRFRPIAPLDEERDRELLNGWYREQRGRARITGRLARNLNPVVVAPSGRRELRLGWWWLHSGGVPAGYSAFNSRDDRLLHSWCEPFQRRALLPASWYVEKGRRFALPHGEHFGIAAITTPVRQPDGAELLSYSMVTRAAVGGAAAVHHRMPLVLPAELHDEWLDAARPGDAGLVSRAILASTAISGEFGVAEHHGAAAPRSGAAEPPAAQPTLF